jgi:hypothetical protein
MNQNQGRGGSALSCLKSQSPVNLTRETHIETGGGGSADCGVSPVGAVDLL